MNTDSKTFDAFAALVSGLLTNYAKIAELKRLILEKSKYAYRLTIRDKGTWEGKARFESATWNEVIASGKSYLVGKQVPTPVFLKSHTSPLCAWQRHAVELAKLMPDKKVVMISNRLEYHIYTRNDYVEIGLPHQDRGGEKHWVTRNGKSKVLVNVD
ncbi:hypothetical protein ANRL1_01329 [Anaerolineae bacterium]|nr:hypothetical protein ANRL1_01329 [Anaerolineae bacterium]